MLAMTGEQVLRTNAYLLHSKVRYIHAGCVVGFYHCLKANFPSILHYCIVYIVLLCFVRGCHLKCNECSLYVYIVLHSN